MSVPRIVTLVAALLLTAFVDLFAQEKPAVAPGAKVRVSAPPVVEKRVVGFVVLLDRDTLVLNVEGRAEPLTVPLASVSVLEVHRGRKSRVGRGALIGLAVGAGGGAIIGALATSDSCLFDPDPCPAAGAGAGALFFVLPGTVIGAIIGALTRTDRWETVPLDQIRVGLTPLQPHGFTVSFSVRF